MSTALGYLNEDKPTIEDKPSSEGSITGIRASGEALDLSETEALARKARWKFDLIVLPIVTIFYFLSFLDRTNIGNARVAGLQKDLKLTEQQFSIVLTISYIPFIISELPANLILKKIRPNIAIPVYCLLWGIAATFQGFVTNYETLLVARFFLGLTEGGLLPGALLYLSSFYERTNLQVRISIFFTATSLAGGFSGLLAYGIGKLDGTAGKAGWRWIFIIEGLVTIFGAFVLGWFLPRSVAHAKFLTDKEREAAVYVLRKDFVLEEDNEPFVWSDVWSTALAPQFLLAVPTFFAGGVCLSGLAVFVPSIIRALGYSTVRTQLLSVPPYAVSFVISNIVAQVSDRYRKRGATLLFAGILATAGFALYYASHDKNVRYGSLFLSISGVYIIAPAGTAWTSNLFAPHYRRASVIAFAYIAVNAGGILSTWIFTGAPLYNKAAIVNLAMALTSVASNLAEWGYLYYANQKKAIERAEWEKTGLPTDQDEKKRMGDRHREFIFPY